MAIKWVEVERFRFQGVGTGGTGTRPRKIEFLQQKISTSIYICQFRHTYKYLNLLPFSQCRTTAGLLYVLVECHNVYGGTTRVQNEERYSYLRTGLVEVLDPGRKKFWFYRDHISASELIKPFWFLLPILLFSCSYLRWIWFYHSELPALFCHIDRSVEQVEDAPERGRERRRSRRSTTNKFALPLLDHLVVVLWKRN